MFNRTPAHEIPDSPDEALCRQVRPNLVDRGVAVLPRRDGVLMGLDPTAASIASQGLGARIALFALPRPPSAHACGTHPEALSSLTVCRPSGDRRQDTDSKVHRTR